MPIALKKSKEYYRTKELYEKLKTKPRGKPKIVHAKHPLAITLRNLKRRCYNEKDPDYYRYGGRGIYVCEEWIIDSNNFYKWALENGYQEGLTIDRIDVNGNYEPSNCRFVPPEEQARNKSNNRLITIGNLTKTLSEWCEIFNVKSHKLVTYRLDNGYTPIEAFVLKPYEKPESKKRGEKRVTELERDLQKKHII